MAKHFIAISMVFFCLLSCTGKKAGTSDAGAVFELDNLMTVVDQQIDQDVVVRGYVTHVCKHSGKKCFITGESGKVSLQIMASGDIGSFDKEIVGSLVEIKGTVKEERLSKEYIDNREKDTQEKQEAGAATEEQCATEFANIRDMREWMKNHNKDHYSIYYMDGLTCQVADE